MTEFVIRRIGIQKALGVLEKLKRGEVGRTVYEHIEKVLNGNEHAHWETEKAYAATIGTLLEAYAKKLPPDSPLRAQLDVLYVRMLPPLSESELRSLNLFISQNASEANSLKEQDILGAPVSSLVETVELTPLTTEVSRSSTNNDNKAGSDPILSAQVADRRTKAPYRRHLHELHDRFKTVQEHMSRYAIKATRHNEEFGIVMEAVLQAVKDAETIEELHRLREIVLNEGQATFSGIEGTVHKLRHHCDELRNTNINEQPTSYSSQTTYIYDVIDELTSLANRRAFMQRLEQEVGRVQRYSDPLALIIIDLDKFKSVNEAYGRDAGDEALRSFAQKLFTVSRCHDLTARYSGEEFAWLLPSTSWEGAMAAISHFRQEVSQSTWNFEGTAKKLPEFSGGVGAYLPGETPTGFVKRIYNAMYRAKRLGGGREELDLPKDDAAILAG